MLNYAPDVAPEPAHWLRMPPMKRYEKVLAVPAWPTPMAPAENLTLVETRLAEGAPGFVEALKALRGARSRADAVQDLAEAHWQAGYRMKPFAVFRDRLLADLEALQSGAPERLVEAMLGSGEDLSRLLRCALAEPERVPTARLVELLEVTHWQDDAPGGGWAPIHAAEALGARKEAAEPLLDALLKTEPFDVMRDAVVDALLRLGPAAVGPCLARMPCALDGELCEVLARCGGRDPRIVPALAARLEGDPRRFARYLGDYGDPAGIPALRALYASLADAFVMEEVADSLYELSWLLDDAESALYEARDGAKPARKPKPAKKVMSKAKRKRLRKERRRKGR